MLLLALIASVSANAIFIGLYLAKKDECASYKAKASHWLESYNRLFSTCYMDLAKEKRNNV